MSTADMSSPSSPSSVGFASACVSGGNPSSSGLSKLFVKTCALLFPLSSPQAPVPEIANPNLINPPALTSPASRTTTSPNSNPASGLVYVRRSKRRENIAIGQNKPRRHSENTSEKLKQPRKRILSEGIPAKKGPVKLPQEEAQLQIDERHRKKMIDEAWEVFTARFVDDSTINWRRIRRRLDARPSETEEDLEKSLHWLFARTNDPFTRYLPSEQLEAMKGDIDGEMCGVGIIFNAERHGWFGRKRVVIKHVVRNSPAAAAGLQRGDRITAIDMTGVESISFDEATARLMGKEGKKVLVSFQRKDDVNTVELSVLLTRKRFEVPTVSAERVFVPHIGDVGFIQIREFAANTASQTRSAVRQIGAREQVDLVVLDMRGNAGGLVDRAVEVAKVFLERGQTVVRFVGRNGEMTTEKCGWNFVLFRRRVNMTKEPMVILVDGDTASASELVAAALRDNCRAVIIGNTTFGKGSVQAIVPLSNGGGAAVTVARYKTPRNESIVMGKGLRPDLFRENLGDDADGVMKQLFGRGGLKRYNWVVSQLDKFTTRGCIVENGGNAVRNAIVNGLRKFDSGT